MSFGEEFDRRVRAVVGGGVESADELLSHWEHVVEACEFGYDDRLDEYQRELRTRAAIAAVLRDERACLLSDVAEFRGRVAAADERFRALLMSEPVLPADEHPWWRAHLPRYARKQFVEDCERRYGVRIRAGTGEQGKRLRKTMSMLMLKLAVALDRWRERTA